TLPRRLVLPDRPAARDAARRRSAAEPRQGRKLLRRALLSRGRAGGDGEGGESARARGQAGAGGKIVARFDPRRLGDTCRVEQRARAKELVGRGELAVELEAVFRAAQIDRGGGQQAIERDRQRSGLWQQAGVVALSPVFDQRDVGVGGGDRLHGEPICTANPPVFDAISRACVSSRARPMAAPPPPAPVNLAPSAPADFRRRTVSSSSGQETPSSRSTACAWSISPPKLPICSRASRALSPSRSSSTSI